MVFLNKNDLSFNIPFSWCQCFNALGICCIKICEQAVTVVSIGVFLIFFHAFSYSGVYFQGIWLIFLCYSHINKRGRKSSLPLISKKPLLFLFLKLNAPLLRETTQPSAWAVYHYKDKYLLLTHIFQIGMVTLTQVLLEEILKLYVLW